MRANPIHGEDLAAVCADAVDRSDKELNVGGPETLTQNEMASTAFDWAAENLTEASPFGAEAMTGFNEGKVMLEGNKQQPKTDYSHDLLTREALGFIRENRGNPFFLYLPYTIPHAKFEVPELGQYAEKPWPAVKG